MTTSSKSLDFIDVNHNPIFAPSEHDYLFTPAALNICAEQVVLYISGFVARVLSTKVKCAQCSAALFGTKK